MDKIKDGALKHEVINVLLALVKWPSCTVTIERCIDRVLKFVAEINM